jgi:hypothetical protein
MDLDAKEIENLRKVYNEEHPNEPPIPASKGLMKGSQLVWNQIQKRMHNACKTHRAECIISHMLQPPTGPKTWNDNPEEWITSEEIDILEKRFEKLFVEYKHIGTFPIDFDKHSKTGECLVSTLCSMDLPSLYKKGYRQFGLIFNTDISSGPGEHWMAVFCDISTELEYPRMTYFDSYAHKPEKQIQVLMKRWKKQWDATKLQKPMKLSYNGTRHQYEDSECGVYSVYFHYCCLMGIPMDKPISDEVVRGLRGVLFKIPK